MSMSLPILEAVSVPTETLLMISHREFPKIDPYRETCITFGVRQTHTAVKHGQYMQKTYIDFKVLIVGV